MIDHASAGVSDVKKSKELYKAMLAPLGYEVKMDLAEYNAAGFGTGDRSDFWLGQPEGGKSPGTVHIAFLADSTDAVDAFYKAGLAAGGADNGAPGYRTDYAPNYYAAFVHDFDGNNVEVVFRDPSKSAKA